MKKKITSLQWKLILFASIVAFSALYWVRYSNSNKKKNETFKGVVLKKYYRRGNTIDVKLYTGEIHTTHIGLQDKDFIKISIGDTVEMRAGEFIYLK